MREALRDRDPRVVVIAQGTKARVPRGHACKPARREEQRKLTCVRKKIAEPSARCAHSASPRTGLLRATSGRSGLRRRGRAERGVLLVLLLKRLRVLAHGLVRG